MKEKIIIIHIPVIHRGYLDFFKKNKKRISNIYIIEDNFLKELSEFRPDIASLDTKTTINILKRIGFKNVLVLSKKNIKKIKDKEIVLVQDEISRNLAEKFLKGRKIEWVSVFLRWDKGSVLEEKPIFKVKLSKKPIDIKILKEAFGEAKKSGDWWRQVGAVLVKDKKIILRAYNQGLPSDHTPYQVGAARDFFKAGERQDLVTTLHAEPRIIAEAAKYGISLKGASLYVTHFPCSVCAKIIACSGIKELYFARGGSNFDGKIVLDSAGVKLIYISFQK